MESGTHGLMESAEQLFSELDTDKDGYLSNNELIGSLLDRGTDPDQVSELFSQMDTDTDGASNE